MNNRAYPTLAAVLLGLLSACAEEGAPEPSATASAEPPAATAAPLLPAPNTGPATPPAVLPTEAELAATPQIYMALQPDSAGTVSVLFAIDESKDGTPEDDPGVRITPEGGDCNPQELRRFGLPAGEGGPTFGPAQAAQGVNAQQLPAYMAVAVTQAMLQTGLAETQEQTAPQNICTNKLWQRLVNPQTADAGQTAQ